MFRKVKIGLALGSGGARGLAHIGVIKALEKAGIPIHVIAGSSIGALVGGMYAQTLDIADVERRLRSFFLGDEFRRTGLQLFRQEVDAENFFGQIARTTDEGVLIHLERHRMALMKTNRLTVIMDLMLGDGLIENTRIKFAPVATNLASGEIVVFRSGSIREAVKASSSVPGFLPPVEYRGMVLVEGAVGASIPVEPAFALGADVVIAVNVSRSIDDEPMPGHVIDILFRTSLITSLRNDALACERAHVVVRPAVGRFHWAEFAPLEELIRLGEEAAAVQIEALQTILKKKPGRFSAYRAARPG